MENKTEMGGEAVGNIWDLKWLDPGTILKSISRELAGEDSSSLWIKNLRLNFICMSEVVDCMF